jgi:hypothetical protein
VNALPEKFPWQVRATTLITLIAPPTASLVLLAVYYFEYWRAVSFSRADFLAAYFLFAIPAGYVFGAVPALLAASLYCALLTVNSRLRRLRPLIRACIAAICGGLASGVWFSFWEQLRTAWGMYGLVGALVMAALSRGMPQPPQPLEKGGAGIARPGLNKGAPSACRARDQLGHKVDLSRFRRRLIEMSGGAGGAVQFAGKRPTEFPE